VIAHGWRQLPPFAWDAEAQTLARVDAFSVGTVALSTIRGLDRAVEVCVSEDVPEDEVIRRVRKMLQLDLPMDGFHAFCAAHPKLARVPALRQGRLLRCPTLFEDLLKVVATTNTTWSQTKGMVTRLVKEFGTPMAADPKRKTFPRPDQIASVTLEEFAAKAKMGYRNAAVHKIANDVVAGRLDLDAFEDPSLPATELYKGFLALPGVGPYAASCLMIYLGRYDRVNVDSWARTMVGKQLGRPVTDKEVHAFFEPCGEWKALVYHFYPWKEDPPAY
jgi:3-methyladenine DNA glycosylase/8-oxoguanine DNA glycosylase